MFVCGKEDKSENSISVVESMWKVILTPGINIFSQLQKESSNEIGNFLKALLRTNLSTLLVPVLENSPNLESFQKRYAAYVKWLFGVVFYVTGSSENDEILECSIELQSKMLKLLIQNEIPIHSFIISEYFDILEELLQFDEFCSGGEKLELCKFQTERNLIDNWDLKPLPVTIKLIELTQISVLQIVLKTGFSNWNYSSLWDKTLRILKNSSPETKIVSLKVMFEFLELNLASDIEIEILIKHMMQIVNIIPSWSQTGIISRDIIQQYTKVFSKFLKMIRPTAETTRLCFMLVDLIAKKILGNELEQEVYDKIYEYQKYNPRSHTLNLNQCIIHSETLPKFNSILIHDILSDVKNNSSKERLVNVTEVSKLWARLRGSFIKNLTQKNFIYISRFLESTSLLSSWFVEHKIQAQLFGEDMEVIFKFLLENLNDTNDTRNSFVFQCLIHLMAHTESNKVKILHILSLPWSEERPQSMDSDFKEIAKSIDFETKLKCLETICRHGSGDSGLYILKECISNSDLKFSIAAIPNCLLLSTNDNVKVEEILKVMHSTLSLESPELHAIVAKTLGELICLLSKCATLIRESWDKSKLIVKCNVCDKPEQGNDSRIYNLSLRYETIISSFFDALITSNSEEVRLQMSKNFLRFSNHIKEFNTRKTANLWLPYIHDNNPDVRSNIGNIIGYLLQNRIAQIQQTHVVSPDSIPIELNEFVDSVLLDLQDSMLNAANNKNSSLHFHLLLTAKNFACVQLHLTEKRILSLFIYTLIHPHSKTREIALAITAFEKVAGFYNLTPKEMYVRYRKHFIKIMVDMAVLNLKHYNYNMLTSFHLLSRSIGYDGTSHLVTKEVHHLVTFLIPHIVETPKAISLLDDIAERNLVDKSQLLRDYFHYICPHVMLNVEQKLGVKCLNIVLEITKLPMQKLMKRSFMDVFGELFLQFQTMEDLCDCLELISAMNGEPKNFESNEEVAAYINPNLHGVLVYLELNIRQITDEETQQSAIASLVALIHFMGPQYISPLRYKLLSTLRMLLNFTRPGFRKLTYQAWDAFIRNTFIHDLGPLLPTIFSSVVPLLESFYKKETNKMLEYLIVENEESFSLYISELFFIEDINVSENISNIVTTCIKRRSSKCIKENLGLWIKRIGHEIDNVRLRALVHMKKFLAENRSELNGLILTNSSVHPLILELLDMLIAGCRDKDEGIQLAYGECLGELGAIEPSLLPRRIVSRDDSKFISDINGEFACAALIELARGFQMQTNTHDTDCFSLSIQEILKAYDISPESSTNSFWGSIPFTVREMISPCLTSHYVIQIFDNQNVYPHPIYGTDKGRTFDKWAYNWIMSMSGKVRDQKVKNILITSTPAFKRDVRTVEFFIPYIATHIIANGTKQEWKKIAGEMLAVITDHKLINTRPLLCGVTESKSTSAIDKANRFRCSRVVFLTLEHLQRWLRERRLDQNEQYKAIQKFCELLDGFVLAEGSYKTDEHHRALMYLEQHMAISKKGLSDAAERDLLVEIYQQLEEPDGVSGILASQNDSPTLQQLVLAHEISGQFQDAATCYEKIAQRKDPEPKDLQGMIQCYLNLDQPFTAMAITKGVLENRPELEPLMIQQECFWRLAHFGKTDDVENVKHSYLENLKNGVKPNLTSVKKKILSSLADASNPRAYEQSYYYIMRLHIINEFEKAIEKILENVNTVPSIFEEWDKRFQLVRASRGVEFVLSMRRATLNLAFLYQQEKTNVENSVLKEEIGKIWIKSAKIARKAELYQQAYMYVLSAGEMCKPQELCTEMAQLYWQKGNQEYAFSTLKRCFNNYFPHAESYKRASVDEKSEERKQCAKAKLLFAKYNHETLNVQTATNIKNFKDAIAVWKFWEKSYVACAQYFESCVSEIPEEMRDLNGREFQVHTINYYAKSLTFGCKYIHQSMPRILTIWLEFASRTNERKKDETATAQQVECLERMTKIMGSYFDTLPTFTWLTAFSQLVSRIFHPSKEVQGALKTIIVKLIVAYPQHCLWMMASIFNSSYPARRKRCLEILNHEKMKNAEIIKLIEDFRKLWAKLIELSNKPVPSDRTKATISSLSSDLPNLLNSSRFSSIMMPTSEFRKLHLPLKGASLSNHEPFLRNWIGIVGIEDSITIMPSLQRPKRISLKGSDGKNYLFMCKPKDDLRRDFRLMEFNDIVNKYLQNDPKCRQRRLYIRTYSVVPLNEECGLIEWISNLVGLRPIIMKLYQEKGLAISNKMLRSLISDPKELLAKKRKNFEERLLPRHPAVLSEWFRLTFPDPYGWYEARTAYIRTTAVMSMVGYILGLGDRHGENILFDSKCGDCVHVDFNCLFNRGETLEVPERVPFRLTHNMIDAMGPLKYEGPFRRSCEVTMRVLREQTTTLMSVLTPFVYDPLVSNTTKDRHVLKLQHADKEETIDERTVLKIRDIHQRLQGEVRSMCKKEETHSINLYLSVEGQTNLLILEATNVDNLCQMYYGWGAFM